MMILRKTVADRAVTFPTDDHGEIVAFFGKCVLTPALHSQISLAKQRLSAMKLITIYLLVTSLLLSGCMGYHKLHSGYISHANLESLKPKNLYAFTLQTGQVLKVYIESNENETITGYYLEKQGKGRPTKVSYTDTYDAITKNVNRISVEKFSLIGTLTAVSIIVLSVSLIGLNATDSISPADIFGLFFL